MKFAEINSAALADIDKVLSRWLPGGKRKGHEYICRNPRRSDRNPGSFSLNMESGAWADFATGDKGRDIISLIAYLDDVKQSEAARRISELLQVGRGKPGNAAQIPKGRTQKHAREANVAWRALVPVPADAPRPPVAHPRHGPFSARWEYHDDAGALLCHVYRFDAQRKGERKQFAPLTFCVGPTKTPEWRWQGLPDPRPLYHLNRLAATPDAPVIVCEGEKAADAAAALFPDAVTTTMLNGAQSPQKTNWAPLKGRTVWLWPDNDDAGRACMVRVAELLAQAGAAKVHTLNLGVFVRVPGIADGRAMLGDGAPPCEKWDAADAVADGWTAEHVQLLRAQTDFFLDSKANKPTPELASSKHKQSDAETLEPCSHVNDKGVWYYGRSDTGSEAPPLWLCSRLEIIARTRDALNESWGRLVQFNDADGKQHTWAMPMEMLKSGGDEYRGVLYSMGLEISTTPKARNLLTHYIQTAPVSARARCVERTGWHENVFVLPDRTIGDADERILFQSARAAPSAFARRGDLADWRRDVAALCAGNTRLVFAVSAAMAAPLLHVASMESGGLHFRGDSSTGKTTALRVAASVWGGADYLQRWRATDNGLEALAAQHSDCLLVLDEISQVDPKVVGEVSYMLANGGGKARANRTGSMRESASWRLLFLSSGEDGLAEQMALAGRKPKAGMEVRLLEIPADAGQGLGLFEDLHGHPNGATSLKALTSETLKYFGTPALEFIARVAENRDKLPEAVKSAQRAFIQEHLHGDSEGQAHRAAQRFALVGTAGELATEWGITGWQRGEAMRAAETCFAAWLAQRGGGANQEAAAIIAQVQKFIEQHGDARFTPWDRATDQHAPKTMNRAGFRKNLKAKDKSGQQIYDADNNEVMTSEYYVLPEVFKEICAGHDTRAVLRLLAERGYLLTEGQSYKRKERLPGMGNVRCYRITPKLLSGDE